MSKYIIYILFLLSTSARAQEIKILSWNIFMIPPIIFKSCQQERATFISNYINIQNPDVVVLEEAFIKSINQILVDSLKSQLPYSTKPTKRGLLKLNSGILILSKYPIENQYNFIFKKRKGSDRFAKKGAVLAQINIKNKPVQIVGVHAQSLKKYEQTRFKQFNQFKQDFLDKHQQANIPQLICGDLNVNYYDTIAYKNMLHVLNTVPCVFDGLSYSWNGIHNDLAFKFSEHTLETLDYILLNQQHRNLVTLQPITILEANSDTCFCKFRYTSFSDHYPIISTIQIK